RNSGRETAFPGEQDAAPRTGLPVRPPRQHSRPTMLRFLRASWQQRTRGRRKTRACPLRLEALEARWVPSQSAGGTGPLPGAYGQLPLTFEANQGQVADPSVDFLARGPGYTVFLTPGEAVLRLMGTEVVRMQLVGARSVPAVGQEPAAGRSN